MIYCEYRNNEYYALGVLSDKTRNFNFDGIKLYNEVVSCLDDWQKLRGKEGLFTIKISEQEALFKFLKCPSNRNKTIQETMDIFYNTKPNTMLLVESGLL